MRKAIFGLCLLVLAIGLFHPEKGIPQSDSSDFSPPSGADGPITAGRDGPGFRRLRIATSPDGMTWTRTGVTLSNQSDVPNAITVDGTLWIFFVLWNDADKTPALNNTVSTAYSSDLVHWTYKQLYFDGPFPEGRNRKFLDPSVVRVSEDSFRMYFTLFDTDNSEPAASYSAISSDLIHWTLEEGPAFTGDEGYDVLDPNLLWVEDHYEFFAGGVPGSNYHAVSTDGRTFTKLDPFSTDPNVVMANGAVVNGQYKYYGFRQVPGMPANDIRSLTYTGNSTWVPDEGVWLEVDESTGEERDYVQDPAVASHPQGEKFGYVMIYVTRMPMLLRRNLIQNGAFRD